MQRTGHANIRIHYFTEAHEPSTSLWSTSEGRFCIKAVADRFGITEAEVRRAREEEDILQYVMRGAIRRPDFDGDYDIYLYSKRQAGALAARLEASASGRIHVVPVTEAGLMNYLPRSGKLKPAHKPNAASAEAITVESPSGRQIKPKSIARSRQRAKAASSNPPKPRGRLRKSL